MAGMYPNNETLQIFGEEVAWPGLDPVTGKFTNGSFSDPLVKPSFIPAETINLLLDNLATLITDVGLTPDSVSPGQLLNALQKGFMPRIVGQYVSLNRYLSAAELTRYRLLPLEYQVIQIALYEELCNFKWVGPEANETADWWYKCDENGVRNENGLYMQVEDARGLFFRNAGQNALKSAANDAPYDGKEPGSFAPDKTRATVPPVAFSMSATSPDDLASPWDSSNSVQNIAYGRKSSASANYAAWHTLTQANNGDDQTQPASLTEVTYITY